MSKKDKRNQQQEGHHNNHRPQQQQNQSQPNAQSTSPVASNLQVEPDKETGNWTVHPIARQKEPVLWIVECNTKNEANNLKNDIANGKSKAPIEDPQHYSTPRRHSNGKTLIYYPKAS